MIPLIERVATVRVRTTIGATVVVALALGASSFALTLMLRSTMIANVDASLELRAADIGALIEGGTLPDSVAIEGEEDGFVQIVNASGQVVASSSNVDGESELTTAPPGAAVDLASNPLDDEGIRVYVYRTAGPAAMTVIVGRSLEGVEQTTRTLAEWMLVGAPALTLLVAAVTWIVVGRALRPVDAIRAEVADIGGSDLHRRVPTTETNDEIGRLAATMNQMLDRLESASERQKRFVSDASHELRTPIATVRHEIDVARLGPNDELPAVLDEISDENQRMEHLVDDLLLLARQDQAHDIAEKAVAHLAIVDLDDLALVEAHRTRATAVTIDVTGLVDAPVHGDERQLGRLVRNLVDNAVRHAHQQVRMATSIDGPATRLTVEDDGPGIAVEDRERVFERFTRADAARGRDAGGSGLGLAIARELVHNHNGLVEISDSPTLGGARITVTLPSPDRTTT